MKEILKKVDKINIILSIIYKSSIYICWYLFALIFYYFVRNTITDGIIIRMCIYLFIIYIIRTILKNLYKKTAYDSYYSLKHAIEVEYFKKLKNVTTKSLNEIDKKSLSSSILNYSFYLTKIVRDIGEIYLPIIIGLVVFFVIVFNINIIVGIISLVIIIISLLLSYNDIGGDLKANNYNDILVDFINKIETIRKLKIFDYCLNKLENNRENDICILKDSENVTSNKLNIGIFLMLILIFITILVVKGNTSTKLGLIIFFAFMIIKLQDLFYQVISSLKGYKNLKGLKKMLDSNYQDTEHLQYAKKWKSVHIKDLSYTYESGIKINIPDFELIKGDQIGIIGKTGQGKSTILNILNGDISGNTGFMLFDGNQSKKVVDALYINNKVELFKICLKDNLTFGKNEKDETIINLINEIGLNEWFNELPNGLDTIMDNNYVESSILQRLNIIRSIILDKEICFFDEPTSNSNLDVEKLVASIIKKYFKKKTFIIVSHRPLLTNLCNKHYFIKDHTLLEKESLL